MIKKIITICKFTVVPLLLGFPIAIIAYRMQLWNMGTSFKIIKITGYVSVAVLALVILLGILACFKKQKGVVKGCSVIALLLAMPVIGLSMEAVKAKSLPFLHQVSTDTTDLPKFDAIIALRGENSNPLEYDAEKLASLQKSAYPEVKTIVSTMNAGLSFIQAVKITEGLGWEIVAQNADKGIIEAVDTTALWGFKDDIVIRIQATDSGSKIDLRSISRIGRTDLGANAARIKNFILAFKRN